MPVNYSDYPKNWREISLRVLKRSGFICKYCMGGRKKNDPFTRHHVDHDPMNLNEDMIQNMHSSCHLLFHTTFRSCRTLPTFLEICRNFQSQTNFQFVREFEDRTSNGPFLRYKIALSKIRSKLCQNSLAKNC